MASARASIINMFSFGRIAILLCLITSTLAIDCYKEITKNKAKPKSKSKIACATGAFCKKYDEKIGKDDVHRYGCGWETFGQTCTKNGCTKFKETTTCCCSKDLCNGSSQLRTFLSFATIILVKFVI